MFSPNPYLRKLAVMAYVGIILGIILFLFPLMAMWGLVLFSAGFLSVLGYLIVGGLTWRRQPPSA